MQYLLFFIDQHLWSLGRPLMQNRKSASQACWYCSRRCLSLTASHRHINDRASSERTSMTFYDFNILKMLNIQYLSY